MKKREGCAKFTPACKSIKFKLKQGGAFERSKRPSSFIASACLSSTTLFKPPILSVNVLET